MTDVLMPQASGTGVPDTGRSATPRTPNIEGADVGDERAQPYVALFDRVESTHEPQWLRAIRRGAIERFARIGFPTTKDEDWHFTSVAPITAHEYTVTDPGTSPTVTAEQLAPYLFAGEWDTIVFVNGALAPALSTALRQDDVCLVTSLTEAVRTHERAVEQHLSGLGAYQNNAFTALNTAFWNDGVFVSVRPNGVVARPIHVLHVVDGEARRALLSPRTLVIAEHHAEVTVVESFVSLAGGEPYLTNAVAELYLAPGARVRHYKVQRESESGYHVSSSYAYQQKDSHYESFSYAVGADLSRTNIATVLDGEGAHATVNGLYLVDGKQTVDHQTRIEHAKENCTSHEVYKGVLDGASHGVFNGKVYVRPEAQKTDGKQSNNNLLLSDDARIDTKPQLEIFADDVKCTHGATIGRLDANSLFYLKSRGVAEETARKLLTYAFAADVLEELTIDSVKERLEALVFERFDITD